VKINAALATPTDLTDSQVGKIVPALNQLIADAYALAVKTENFHWHVSGAHFRDYHLLFDEQASSISDSIDPLAERVRKLGGVTIRSIGQIAKLQNIVDNDDNFVSAEDMIMELLSDNSLMVSSIRAAAELCEKNGDCASANLLQDLLNEAEKRVWFLFEASV
jgi:starvation-inducible DNA-binding protein